MSKFVKFKVGTPKASENIAPQSRDILLVGARPCTHPHLPPYTTHTSVTFIDFAQLSIIVSSLLYFDTK